MAKVTLITAATQRVVTVDEFKLHARIDDPSEDTLLADLLDAAEQEAETYTWRKFVTQTWDQYYDDFDDPLLLKYSPVSSITSVTYTDTNGNSQTLAATVYELGEVDGVSVVRRKYNQTWPDTRSHEDVVAVRFVVGYGAPSAVPVRIKQAIREHALHGYRYRGDEMQQPAASFFRLLRPFRLARWQEIGAP